MSPRSKVGRCEGASRFWPPDNPGSRLTLSQMSIQTIMHQGYCTARGAAPCTQQWYTSCNLLPTLSLTLSHTTPTQTHARARAHTHTHTHTHPPQHHSHSRLLQSWRGTRYFRAERLRVLLQQVGQLGVGGVAPWFVPRCSADLEGEAFGRYKGVWVWIGNQ